MRSVYDTFSRWLSQRAQRPLRWREPLGGSAITIAETPAEQPAPLDEEPTPEARPRRSRKGLVAIILLALALAAAVAGLVIYFLQLNDANSLIREQEQQIKEQKQLIDKKETFGAAMQELLDTAAGLEGTRMSTLVSFDEYESVASLAWYHRWKAESLDKDTARVEEYTADVKALLDGAAAQLATNASGSTYEATLDSLGGGYVVTAIDDADTLCAQDVLGCVVGSDPYTVHIDAADVSLPYMTDFIRQGLAYHEFAHVLQNTNYDATELAVADFAGDYETMADCFALTYLAGWSLDQRVWVTSYSWYDVSLGYGYTCTESQKQSVRNWYDGLAFEMRPISQ